jgi:hypothetical protein
MCPNNPRCALSHRDRTARASIRRSMFCLVVLTLLCAGAPTARASTVAFGGAYRFETQTAFDNYANGLGCDGVTCVRFTGSGDQAYTSDYLTAQQLNIAQASDGEEFIWTATEPSGLTTTTVTLFTLTYIASGCNGTGAWVTSDQPGFQYCGNGNSVDWIGGPIITCKQTGSWTLNAYDAATGWEAPSSPFTLSHGGQLGITAPTDNQLFQLLSGNYNATGAIQFGAMSTTGNQVSWSAALHYQSSGNFPNPATDPTPLSFPGSSYSYSGYQSIGGQVSATASTTAQDGSSSVQDCVTFYVEGPETTDSGSTNGVNNGGLTGGGGIPDTTITSRLDQLYPATSSYANLLANDPNGANPTPNLMTGVAERESLYRQFTTFLESNADLFSTWASYQIPAKWPTQNPPNQYVKAGQQIGLMQVATTDPDAWDWTVNTTDGVNLFSNGGKKNPDKVMQAVNYEGWIISGNSSYGIAAHANYDKKTFPGLDAAHRENNALVFYGGYVMSCGGDTTCVAGSLYYIPVCTGTITTKGNTWICNGADWYWAVNDPLVDRNVQDQYVCPSGTASCALGQAGGVSYVINGILFDDGPPYGVRYQLQ